MDAPAGWYPDPLGRNDHRYWDGSQWTDHASRGGATITDPLDGPHSPEDDRSFAVGGIDPEAGTPSTAPAAGTEGLAVVSLLLSILWLFGLGSIAGIITGVMARRRIRRSRGVRTGSGIALAGIIVGVLTLALTVLVGIVLAVLFVGDVSVSTIQTS